MKKIMIALLISILVIIGIILTIGLFLPKHREFIKTAQFKSDPEKVFAIVTDVSSQPLWRSDIKEVQVIDYKTWKEIPKKGNPLTFKIKQKITNELFEIEIIEPKSFQGYWIGTFESTADNGTFVEFKEVIISSNPIIRTLSYVFVDLDKTMELYLSDLKLKLRE